MILRRQGSDTLSASSGKLTEGILEFVEGIVDNVLDGDTSSSKLGLKDAELASMGMPKPPGLAEPDLPIVALPTGLAPRGTPGLPLWLLPALTS